MAGLEGPKKAPPVKAGTKPADPASKPPEPKNPPTQGRQGVLRSPPLKGKSPPAKKEGMESPEEKKVEAKASSSRRLPDPIGSSSEEEVSEKPSSQAKSAERSPTRSPLVRRPHGAKQRKKFARGEYGDRVRFKEPVATVVEDKRRTDAPLERGRKAHRRANRKEKERAPRKEVENSRQRTREEAREVGRRKGTGEERGNGVLESIPTLERGNP